MPAGGLLLKGKRRKTLWLCSRLITNHPPELPKMQKTRPNSLYPANKAKGLQKLSGKVAALWWLIQLAFLTAIRALVRGRDQGRSWWLQGTFCAIGKVTRLVVYVKFTG
jgi:hypothetical protein